MLGFNEGSPLFGIGQPWNVLSVCPEGRGRGVDDGFHSGLYS